MRDILREHRVEVCLRLVSEDHEAYEGGVASELNFHDVDSGNEELSAKDR